MTRLELIRCLISGSRQRAIQETVAAVLVVVFFSGFLVTGPVATVMGAGCALIVAGAMAIVAIVWAFALGEKALRGHPCDDTAHWLPVFYSQARLLRWVPLWYAGPICLGGWLFMAPSVTGLPVGLAVISALWLGLFAGLTMLNQRAAARIESMALALVPTQLAKPGIPPCPLEAPPHD